MGQADRLDNLDAEHEPCWRSSARGAEQASPMGLPAPRRRLEACAMPGAANNPLHAAFDLLACCSGRPSPSARCASCAPR